MQNEYKVFVFARVCLGLPHGQRIIIFYRTQVKPAAKVKNLNKSGDYKTHEFLGRKNGFILMQLKQKF
jgi:hypothetical protein